MANARDRRVNRLIKGAVKRLKRGETSMEPPPQVLSPEESQQFLDELKVRRRQLEADRARWQSDGSRRGYKRFLQVDAEIVRLDQFFKDVGDQG